MTIKTTLKGVAFLFAVLAIVSSILYGTKVKNVDL